MASCITGLQPSASWSVSNLHVAWEVEVEVRNFNPRIRVQLQVWFGRNFLFSIILVSIFSCCIFNVSVMKGLWYWNELTFISCFASELRSTIHSCDITAEARLSIVMIFSDLSSWCLMPMLFVLKFWFEFLIVIRSEERNNNQRPLYTHNLKTGFFSLRWI